MVTYKVLKIAARNSVAVGLKDALLGVQIGTTTGRRHQADRPDHVQPKVFNTNEDAAGAEEQAGGRPGGRPAHRAYMAAVQLDDGAIIGQLADNSGGDEFGLVLQRGLCSADRTGVGRRGRPAHRRHTGRAGEEVLVRVDRRAGAAVAALRP